MLDMQRLMATLFAGICMAQDPGVSLHVHGAGKLSSTSIQGLNFSDVPARLLIQTAYAASNFQIFGGPSWIDSDRYDVQVLTPGGRNLPAARVKLQSLLKDRFKLQFHRENRELPVCTLTVARDGPRMWKTSPGSCIPFDPSVRHPAVPGEKRPDYCGFINHGIDQWLNQTWDGVGVPMNGTDEMPGLVRALSDELHRAVIDKTGLTAKYDFHLVWDRSATQDASTAQADGSAPSLAKAVEDQLGLKLEPGKAPVEVLVIDHIEKPDTK